jgi:hypothetical protein
LYICSMYEYVYIVSFIYSAHIYHSHCLTRSNGMTKTSV